MFGQSVTHLYTRIETHTRALCAGEWSCHIRWTSILFSLTLFNWGPHKQRFPLGLPSLSVTSRLSTPGLLWFPCLCLSLSVCRSLYLSLPVSLPFSVFVPCSWISPHENGSWGSVERNSLFRLSQGRIAVVQNLVKRQSPCGELKFWKLFALCSLFYENTPSFQTSVEVSISTLVPDILPLL